MRQPGWSEYEVALLIDAYIRISHNSIVKKQEILNLSRILRSIAIAQGKSIDESFRNTNGINMRLSELDYIFSNGTLGLKNTSGLFRKMVDLYHNSREEYERILLEAKAMITSILNQSHECELPATNEMIVSFTEDQDYSYTKPLWLRYKSSERIQYNTWAKLYTSLIKQMINDYPNIFVPNMSLLNEERVDIVSNGESGKLRRFSRINEELLIETNLSAVGFVKRIAKAASLTGLTEKDIEIHYIKKALEADKKIISHNSNEMAKETVSIESVSQVEDLLRKSNNGITKNEIASAFPDLSTHQINVVLKSCHAVLILNKFYHRDTISDYNEMAEILLEVITKQFSQNDNYTSALQLYNEAKPRLDDFFFYNNAFDSRQEVYDLAVHLFEQEKYKGYTFIFLNKMHIWKEEPDYPKDFHGLLIKYARNHGNVFTREEALDYFALIGSSTPAQTFSYTLFNTGSRSFLQYDENRFVLREALGINDYSLSCICIQIEKLLEGDDYIATGEIEDYFYTTLPVLPNGISWSALLLEDVLRIYETDFSTIEAGKDNDKKTFPAAIIRKKSHYRCFSDVVWNEVAKSFFLPKEFTASEFRDFLLNKGFIRGSEKMWNVHKTVAGDIRFYWTDNYGRVTIN